MIKGPGPIAALALTRLMTEPGTAICARARDLEASISNMDFSAANHQALALARLKASTTLFKEMYVPGPALGRWADANQYAIKAVSEERTLDSEMILDLHRCLLPESSGNFRTKSVQGGNTIYPETESLPELWKIFTGRLEETHLKTPILAAAEVYQWIVTLHFFEDANGRLARLCADFILLSAGLPPLSFQNDVQGFVSALAEPEFNSVDDAVTRICNGLSHSAEILAS